MKVTSDSESVLNGWVEKLNQALNNGYDGLRLTENTFWLEKKDWSDFANYEEKLDSIIGNYRIMALCTYSLDRCNATEIIDVILNHQFALIKREGKWEQIENSGRKNIAGRKKSEEELRESEKRERARSDELAMVLDAVPAAVWIAHDHPGDIRVTGNQLSCEWLRLPGGANASKSAPARGETRKRFRMFKDGVELQPEEMPVQMSAAGKEIRNYEFDFVYPDGETRHVMGNARPLT